MTNIIYPCDDECVAKVDDKSSDKSFLTILAGVLLIIVFGVIFFQDRLKLKEHYQKVERYLRRAVTIEVNLLEQNNSGISGKAVVTEINEMIYVTANLEGVEDTLAKPMNIRSGTCENLGEIVYPLTDAIDGESFSPPLKTTLGKMATEMPLAILVHMSVRDASIPVACGNMPPLH